MDNADTKEESTSADVTTTAITTTKSAETTTQVTETTPRLYADYASIAGEWFINGDTTLAFIHIGSDGTYKAFYPTGVLESEGTIRYESEESGGTTHYWYNLYSNTGDFFTGFQDDGSAKFSRQGACIVWNDMNERSGDGMAFSNTLPE